MTTGCALEEYHEFFIFLVVWSLAAEKKPLGELDLSSYSMTCFLAVPENEGPEHTETNCTVLRASDTPRTERPGP